jgi:hypothetical protein
MTDLVGFTGDGRDIWGEPILLCDTCSARVPVDGLGEHECETADVTVVAT